MWHFLYAVEGSDIVEGINTRRETPVKAEDLVVNKGSERKVVEQISEVLPHIGVTVLSKALVIEAVDLGDLAGLVVTTEDCDALRISDFESDKECDCFDGVITSINVIPHKKVVRIWIWPADSEQLHQVVKLPVYIAAYCYRAFHWLHVRLILQDFSCLLAKPLYVDLSQLLAGHQALDPSVESWYRGRF